MSADDLLKNAVRIVAAVVRNIHLKRVLHDTHPEPRLNFWRLIYGNCLDMAVIDWCKLFGSDKEPVHWKNVVPEADHDNFRAGLLSALGLSAGEWHEQRRRIKAYRDNLAAHFDVGFIRRETDLRWPDLTMPLSATYFYYDWLRAMMDRKIADSYPTDIRDYCRRFAEQAADAAKAALVSTADMKERVL